MTQIRRASKVSAFADEHEATIEDGHFAIHRRGVNRWQNNPTDRHNQGATFSFVHGHAELWRWLWTKTLTTGQNYYNRNTANAQDLQDLKRVQDSTPELDEDP